MATVPSPRNDVADAGPGPTGLSKIQGEKAPETTSAPMTVTKQMGILRAYLRTKLVSLKEIK